MALTLAEAQRRSNNKLQKGIIEILINEGELLPHIPLKEFVGVTYDYLRESTLPTVSARAVGATWTEDAPTSAAVTAALKIYGGDVDTDKFLSATLSDINDQKAVNVASKLKAMVRHLNDKIIYGDADVNADDFDGLHEFLVDNTGQVIERGTSSAGQAMRIVDMRSLLRLIKPGRPDVIIMSKQVHDNMAAYYENNLNMAMITVDAFGRQVPAFDGIPIFRSDYITDTETVVTTTYDAKTGGATSSIFAVRFGEDALMGIQNGGLTVELFDKLETKDASRVRIKWYLNPVVIKSTLAVAGITGVAAATAWTD